MMAGATSSKHVSSFSVLPGFVSGPLNSKPLRKLLSAAAFHESNDPAAADIIIAHSAACWSLPPTITAKLIIFTGMPLGNKQLMRTFLAAQSQNRRAFIANKHLGLGLRILAMSIWYGLTQPRRNLAIFQANRRSRSLPNYPEATVVFVTARHDPWVHNPLLDDVIKSRPWSFLSLPGSHDHIWEDPEAYVEIVRSYASRLLA